MGVREKVVNVIVKLMEGWKTRLEVTEDGKVLTSRKINSLVEFCLTEVPISMLIEETDGYTMGEREKKESKEHTAYLLTT